MEISSCYNSIKITPVESIVWWKMNFYVTILEAATVCQDPLSGASGDAATHECLGCICEASSKFCNTKMGCVAGGTLCGPFLLSRGFWVDGGRCTDGGSSGKYLISSKWNPFWCVRVLFLEIIWNPRRNWCITHLKQIGRAVH